MNPPPIRLMIEVTGEDTPPTALPAQGVLAIGSAAAKVGLHLTGQGVADVHCAIGRTKDGGWAIKDLGSEYGTLINGQRVPRARLRAGDQILLGSRRLTVIETEESLAAEAARPAAPEPAPTLARPTPELPGIRGYHTVQLLGRGAMGDVFLAVQESLDREVALKVLSSRVEENPEFVRSFQAEARSAAALNHPNVVTVHDVGEHEGVHYLTMEYMDRGSLEERVAREGPLHWRSVLDVMHDAASGLVYAESRGIVHRDIKPANLMQNHTGATKIADLGLATQVSSEAESDGERKIFGTPHFISPEQVRGGKADCRSDLYSLGATAYRLLTGHTPFEGEDSREILRAKLYEEPTPLRHYITEVPEQLVKIVERLMRREPGERYPSASALLKDLDRARAGREGLDGAPPARGPGKLVSRLVPLVVVAVLIGLGAFLIGGDPDDGPENGTGPVPPGDDAARATAPVVNVGSTGNTGPAPTGPDDDTQERLFEIEAENELLKLSQRDLSPEDRRDALLELAGNFLGTTSATSAQEEAERIDAEIIRETRDRLERESEVAKVMSALREAAALDSVLLRPGDSLRAMAVVPGQEELAEDTVFQELRLALEGEVITKALEQLNAGLELVAEHYGAGDFASMRELLTRLLGQTDLPEFPEGRTPPRTSEILELRATIRNRLSALEDLEAEYRADQVIADASALAAALAGAHGLEVDLRSLDFQAGAERVAALGGELVTPKARSWNDDLQIRLAEAAQAIDILVKNWTSWRRTTVLDPRDRRSSSHDAVAISAEGLTLSVRGEQQVVPWSAFGGKTRLLDQLFNGRLSRAYTAEERSFIASLMSLSAIGEALGHSAEMFTPGNGAVFTAKEARELPHPFETAADWCEDVEARQALAREGEAAAVLAEALESASNASWTSAVSGLERLKNEFSETLLVRLLSDGS